MLLPTVALSLLSIASSAGNEVQPPSRVHYTKITERRVAHVLEVAPHEMSSSHGEDVVISWCLARAADEGDWVGLWRACEEVSNITALPPIKLQFLNYSDTGAVGAGELSFRVVNLRDDLVVYLFSGGLEQPVLEAKSNPVVVANKVAPTQRRLSLAPNGSTIAAWTAVNGPQFVRYRGRGEDRWRQTAASVDAFGPADMCGSAASGEGWRATGDAFFAAMDTRDLPRGPVTYQVGSDESGWSAEASFEQPPASTERVTVYLYGDMGQFDADDAMQYSENVGLHGWKQHANTGSANVSRAIEAMVEERGGAPQLALHNGDLSYANGYAHVWDHFLHQVEGIASRVPYMVTLGNHERDWTGTGSDVGCTDSWGECGVPTMAKFRMPWSAGRWPADQPWYSFNFGPVHFVMLSTEHALSGPQAAFVESDLASVDRSVTPWLFVVGHRALYVSAGSAWDCTALPAPYDYLMDSDQGYSEYYSAMYEQLFLKYGVDVVLGAHHHNYQRSHRMSNGTRDDDGFYVLNVGMAGAPNSDNAKKEDDPDFWHLVEDVGHGFVWMEADPESLVWYYAHADDPTTIVDKVELTKPPTAVIVL